MLLLVLTLMLGVNDSIEAKVHLSSFKVRVNTEARCEWAPINGGSRGYEMCAPSQSNFFHFHAVFGKKLCQIIGQRKPPPPPFEVRALLATPDAKALADPRGH